VDVFSVFVAAAVVHETSGDKEVYVQETDASFWLPRRPIMRRERFTFPPKTKLSEFQNYFCSGKVESWGII